MPLTDFQRAVARTIAANRTPESHVVGGAVLNRGQSGLRVSDDIDIVHDWVTVAQRAPEVVVADAEADVNLLRQAGYSVEWRVHQEGFCRALVSRGNEHVRLDWATDASFRFFPAQKDDDFGYCLHRADLAVNKLLALVGRSEMPTTSTSLS